MQLVFLTYLQRSGSTYLANLLDQYDGVGATLATNFPDGILLPELKLKTASDIDSALDQLYTDDKFKSWQLERPALERELRRADLPIDYPRFLHLLLRMYFANTTVETAVIKRGGYVFHLDKLREMFPDCKVLHLWRDPRAVYASQKRAISTNTAEPMSETPIKTALLFRKACAIAAHYQKAPWFHMVRFEDLIQNQEASLEQVCNFLEVERSLPSSQEGTYADAIPPEQRHLHQNVNNGPREDRISAWQKELDECEIYLMQKICGTTLAHHDYPIQTITAPWHHCMCRSLGFLCAEVSHFLRGRFKAGTKND